MYHKIHVYKVLRSIREELYQVGSEMYDCQAGSEISFPVDQIMRIASRVGAVAVMYAHREGLIGLEDWDPPTPPDDVVPF